MEYKEFLLAVTPHIDGLVKATRNPFPYVWTRGVNKLGLECAYNHLSTYFDHISAGGAQSNVSNGVVGPLCKFGEMDCVVGLFFQTGFVTMVVYMGTEPEVWESNRVLYYFEMSPAGRLLKSEGHFGNLVK